jgi:hypothetical protein
MFWSISLLLRDHQYVIIQRVSEFFTQTAELLGKTKCLKYRNIFVGLSSGNLPDGSFYVDKFRYSYGIPVGYDYFCWLSGKKYPFEWSNGAIKPEWKGQGDVVGCGLVLNPGKELSIFFTGNGILMGQFLIDSSF